MFGLNLDFLIEYSNVRLELPSFLMFSSIAKTSLNKKLKNQLIIKTL